MAKRKVEEKAVETELETPVLAERTVTPEEEKQAQQPEAQKAAATPEGEVEFLSPHDVYRPAQEGTVAEIDTYHVVLEVEGGKKFALPYNAEAHKELKVGDKFKF